MLRQNDIKGAIHQKKTQNRNKSPDTSGIKNTWKRIRCFNIFEVNIISRFENLLNCLYNRLDTADGGGANGR